MGRPGYSRKTPTDPARPGFSGAHTATEGIDLHLGNGSKVRQRWFWTRTARLRFCACMGSTAVYRISAAPIASGTCHLDQRF
jgi:hypothetical protein